MRNPFFLLFQINRKYKIIRDFRFQVGSLNLALNLSVDWMDVISMDNILDEQNISIYWPNSNTKRKAVPQLSTFVIPIDFVD